MKGLSPVWFLKSPIDVEHKYYILLDFLKSISSEIRDKKIYSPVKKISGMIKELNYFDRTGLILSTEGAILDNEDKKIISSDLQSLLSEEEKIEVKEIVKNSLRILYKYADLGVNLWKSVENRIKIFNLNSPENPPEFGITIFRNMSTNEIFSYWWKKVEMNLDGENKRGIVLKKVPVLNNYYSMSYEFIVHETLDSMGIRNGSSFACTIIEISEDFNLNSEIFKIAKEKFIKEIDPED